MELYDIKTNEVIKHILNNCKNNIKGFNDYTKESQKLIILNAIMRNLVLEEIYNMIDYMVEND